MGLLPGTALVLGCIFHKKTSRMKFFFSFFLACACIFPTSLFSQNLPFTLELEEATHEDWPGLHSFAFGKWEGKCVFVAGRSNGLHGFFPFTAFPSSDANPYIWVMDAASGETWNWDVNDLAPDIQGQLLSSNPQYFQKDNFLYMTGGYGKVPASDDFITWPKLTAFDLEILIPLIINGQDPSPAIRQYTDERFRICGGEMHELGEDVFLVGGHDFAGLYSSNGVPTFTQTYTSEILRFRIEDNGTDLAIQDFTVFQGPEFHRRDGNLAALMMPDGSPALGVYGGVFKPDVDAPYLHPIYISPNEIEVDSSYFQKMSQYTCALLPMFDDAAQTMYTVLFGGISLHYYDEASAQLVPDSLMPFINDITTLVRLPDGSHGEHLLDVKFDALLGTNAKFIPADGVPFFDNNVLKINDLTERTLVGYIYGGIHAVIPNITPSDASNRLFKVWLTPAVSGTEELAEVHLYAYPNPFSHEISLGLPPNFNPEKIVVTDLSGQTLWQFFPDGSDEAVRQAEAFLRGAKPGVYFLELENGRQKGRLKLVKI